MNELIVKADSICHEIDDALPTVIADITKLENYVREITKILDLLKKISTKIVTAEKSVSEEFKYIEDKVISELEYVGEIIENSVEASHD